MTNNDLYDFHDIDKQIHLIREKGIKIPTKNIKNLKDILIRENHYFLINGFEKIFDLTEKDIKKFGRDITINDYLLVYDFDQKIRSEYLKYILKIENNIASVIAYFFSEKIGSVSMKEYLKPKHHLKTNDNGKEYHEYSTINILLKTMVKQFNNGIENNHIKEYYDKNEELPLTVLIRGFEFGQMKHFYKDLADDVRTKVANYFSVDSELLDNILDFLNDFRNICAHNQRFYNYRTYVNIEENFRKNLKWRDFYDKNFKTDNRNDNSVYMLTFLIYALYYRKEKENFFNNFIFDDLITKVNSELYHLNLLLPKKSYRKIRQGMGIRENWEINIAEMFFDEKNLEAMNDIQNHMKNNIDQFEQNKCGSEIIKNNLKSRKGNYKELKKFFDIENSFSPKYFIIKFYFINEKYNDYKFLLVKENFKDKLNIRCEFVLKDENKIIADKIYNENKECKDFYLATNNNNPISVFGKKKEIKLPLNYNDISNWFYDSIFEIIDFVNPYLPEKITFEEE